jgi:asparaginyl-tRNA synthetase
MQLLVQRKSAAAAAAPAAAAAATAARAPRAAAATNSALHTSAPASHARRPSSSSSSSTRASAAAAPALADDQKTRQQQPSSQAAADAAVLPPPSDEPRSAPRERLEFQPRQTVRQLLLTGTAGERAEVKGWVRTVRSQKALVFVNVNDGSSVAGLQVVASPADTRGWQQLADSNAITTGCSVRVVGTLQASPGAKQALELRAESVELVGGCDAESYPLQKKRHTLEFLRGVAHLRPRTNTIGAAARVRSCLAFATHEFFTGSGFQYVHTPIISASDCEGAGEMFQVTTLLQQQQQQQQAGGGGGAAAQAAAAAAPATAASPPPPPPPPPPLSPEEVKQLEQAVAEQGDKVRAAKAAANPDKQRVEAEVQALLALKAKLAGGGGGAFAAGPQAAAPPSPSSPSSSLDYARDFFGEPAFLTVSGQLNAEMYSCALGDVYTFGPTFRAENSNTARHLAEFWMVEPEMAFCDLSGDMACAEAYLRHCVKRVLERCPEDVDFFDAQVEKGLRARLEHLAASPFETVTYTEAVRELQKAAASSSSSGPKFEYPVTWGCDLQSEHERWLAETVGQGKPLIVTDYPKEIKAFYMRLNEDGRTVAAMDVLVPKVGELVGGSQREERLPVLEARMRQVGLNPEEYGAYLDLRRYGSVPHAGFGLGFERLVQFCTGIDNIRDVIPFPRYPGHVAF